MSDKKNKIDIITKSVEKLVKLLDNFENRLTKIENDVSNLKSDVGIHKFEKNAKLALHDYVDTELKNDINKGIRYS